MPHKCLSKLNYSVGRKKEGNLPHHNQQHGNPKKPEPNPDQMVKDKNHDGG